MKIISSNPILANNRLINGENTIYEPQSSADAEYANYSNADMEYSNTIGSRIKNAFKKKKKPAAGNTGVEDPNQAAYDRDMAEALNRNNTTTNSSGNKEGSSADKKSFNDKLLNGIDTANKLGLTDALKKAGSSVGKQPVAKKQSGSGRQTSPTIDNTPVSDPQTGMSNTAKIAIGVVAVAIIGGAVYFMTKKTAK